MKIKAISTAAYIAAVLFQASANLYAQAEVVESNNRLIDRSQIPARTQEISPSTSSLSPATINSSSAQGASESFYQLQLLQQEVSQLRGLVEEQSYEIKRLKQQRLDDYISLDRRISSMGGKVSTSNSKATSDKAIVNTDLTAVNPATNANELTLYQAAVDLSLKQKDYQQGANAFNKYLEAYPHGRFMANSQYWLGELALLEGNLESAREWFSLVVTKSPKHDKVSDASYKLGTVYHKLGDSDKANELLSSVAAGSSSASRLAKGYLANNF
jgi:tol-pal system protein YbgF